MKLFAFVRDVVEAGAKQMLWVVIRWEVVLGSPGVLRVRVCADVAGVGTKWLLWAVIKWEGGVLGWWTHLGPFAFARDVAGVGTRRVLRAVMRWRVFVVLDSPGLVTAPVRVRRGRGLVCFCVPM